MSLDSILTVVGLLLAAYQIMPLPKQLDLRLRLHRSDKVAAIITAAIVVYLQFYEVFATIGWTPRLGLSRYALTPQRVTAIIVLLFAGYLWGRLRWGRLNGRRLHELGDLIEELARTDHALELVAVLKRHFGTLVEISRQKTLRERIRMCCGPPTHEEFILAVSNVLDPGEPAPAQRPATRSLRQSRSGAFVWSIVSRVLRATDRDDAILADKLLRRLLIDPYFAKAVARIEPYLALRILDALPVRDTREFLDSYVEELLVQPSSVLYAEIRNNQNVTTGNDYLLPAGNRLLRYFFDDATVAHRFEVYRSFGEAALRVLDAAARDPVSAYNRGPAADDRHEAVSRYPVFAACFVFELMVTRAVRQGITWHMWLMYFNSIIEHVVRNYQPGNDPLYDVSAPIPTRYAELLGKMFRWMGDWAASVEDLSETNPNLATPTLSEHNYETIPKSAILAIARAVRGVVSAPTLEPHVVEGLVDRVLNLMLRLPTRGGADYARLLLAAVKPKHSDHVGYEAALAAAFNRLDLIPHLPQRRTLVDEMRTAFAAT
jgi:hypothetical protein